MFISQFRVIKGGGGGGGQNQKHPHIEGYHVWERHGNQVVSRQGS